MGVSFRVGRAGTRYKPKVMQIEDKQDENASLNVSKQSFSEGNLARVGVIISDDSNKNAKPGSAEDFEVSFSLHLFPNGFSLGKAAQLFVDVPKQLHPYDRRSKALFSAIECGWLPGDIFNDIPCKYVNGAILCEIRDYRNCFLEKEGSTFLTGNSPILHKVLLRMCMETVVKDISSMSTGSLTYKDLLEIESCILKALTPELHLNPEPLWHRASTEPQTKLNLEISWSWKKRKFNDVPSGSSYVPVHCVTKLSDLHSCIAHEDSIVTCPGGNTSRSFQNTQGNMISLESTNQSDPLMLDPNSVLPTISSQSLIANPSTSNFVSVPNQSSCNTKSISLNTPSSSTPAKGKRCKKQAIETLIYKKPKQELLEFSQQQHFGSEAILAPELQCKDNEFRGQHEIEKVLSERPKNKLEPIQSINADQMVLQGLPEWPVRIPPVKPEPAETSSINSDFRKVDQSHLQHTREQLSSSSSRANIPHTSTVWDTFQPIDSTLKNPRATQMRETLQNSQLTAGNRSVSVTPQDSTSILQVTPANARQKTKCCSRSSKYKVDSVSGIRRTDAVNASPSTAGKLPLPQTVMKVDITVDRLLKIQKVSQRYGLTMTNRKHTVDFSMRRKPFFHTSLSLVGFHLSSIEDNGKSESKFIAVYRTRTLTFAHKSHTCQRSEGPIVNTKALTKLVLSEKLEEGTVDAQISYGREECVTDHTCYLPSFPNNQLADRFAAQFTSLMVREGYCAVGDQAESMPSDSDGNSGSQQPKDAISAVGPSSSGPGPLLFKPVPGNLSSHEPTQLSLLNILSGGHLASHGKNYQSLQFVQDYVSKPQLDIAVNISTMQQQWLQIVNKNSLLKAQMQLRHLQQLELEQRKRSLADPGATTGVAGALQFTGMLGNINPGSSRDNMAFKTLMPTLAGGIIHWISNLDGLHNLEYYMSAVNGSNQQFGMFSDNENASLANLPSTEGIGASLTNGQSAHSYCSPAPNPALDVSRIERPLNNSHSPQVEASLQSNMLLEQQMKQRQQQMRSRLQPVEVFSLDALMGLPLIQVGTHEDEQVQNREQQLTLQQMNSGNAGCPESPELTSRIHGSVGVSKS